MFISVPLSLSLALSRSISQDLNHMPDHSDSHLLLRPSSVLLLLLVSFGLPLDHCPSPPSRVSLHRQFLSFSNGSNGLKRVGRVLEVRAGSQSAAVQSPFLFVVASQIGPSPSPPSNAAIHSNACLHDPSRLELNQWAELRRLASPSGPSPFHHRILIRSIH